MAERSARERRAAGRQERRARESPTSTAEELIDAAPATEALRTAATAAIAGAAIGAAKAFAHRAQAEHDHEEPTQDEGDEPADDVQEPVEPEVPEGRDEDTGPPPAGEPLATSEVGELVARAREELRALRGVEAESVSSVRPTARGWRIGLEVVELRRIPESTDVLATYEVELDAGGGLITFERAARYHRSEADRR